jgi:hypothetical protein
LQLQIPIGDDNKKGNCNCKIQGSFAALRMTEKERREMAANRKGGGESVVGDCVMGLVGEVVVEEFVAGFVASLDLEE